MEFDLQEKIEKLISRYSPSVLKEASLLLSSTYQQGNTSSSIFSNDAKTLAYLAVRFPATLAASTYVLQKLLEHVPTFSCKRLLDLGAGMGTATLGALSVFPKIEEMVCIEKAKQAIDLGKELLLKENVHWIYQDVENTEMPQADLAILSYSLGELSSFEPLFSKLCNSVDAIAIIEPGTPERYKIILKVRDLLLKKGWKIVAPCPHAKSCPLKTPNWCHFSTRLERTKLHRMLKGGSLGYEDEKFSYLIMTKEEISQLKGARILRHPMHGSGHLRLNLCKETGEEKEIVVSRKDGDQYKRAKKSSWGDLF